jgi:hypothetical protein
MAQEGKNHYGEKMVSQLSASDVTCVVSLGTNNQGEVFKEIGELVRDVFVYYVILVILFFFKWFYSSNFNFSDLFLH